MAVTVKFDTSEFDRAVDRIVNSGPVIPTEIARTLLLEWLRLIILKWPVRSGRSRAGFGAGAKYAGIEIPRSDRPEADENAYQEGLKTGDFKAAISGDRIVLTVMNKVSYSLKLEGGWSLQAPVGAVEVSARELAQGRIPERALDVYRKLWDFLGLHPQGGVIRAQDVTRAMAELGVTKQDVLEAVGLG